MKRFLPVLGFLGGLAVSMICFGDASAQDENRIPSNGDLQTDYSFILTQLTNLHVGPEGTVVVNYCEIQGTLTFNGTGGVIIRGTSRCSTGGTQTLPPTNASYSVSPDGSFTMTSPDNPTNIVHGRILAHAHTLLVDGTTSTNPDELVYHMVAIRN